MTTSSTPAIAAGERPDAAPGAPHDEEHAEHHEGAREDLFRPAHITRMAGAAGAGLESNLPPRHTLHKRSVQVPPAAAVQASGRRGTSSTSAGRSSAATASRHIGERAARDSGSRRAPMHGAGALRRRPLRRASLLDQERDDQQRDDVDDLDHRVEGRAGGVLVRVADRVAGDGRLVGVAALAAVLAVFDELLGVVPRAAARGHGDRHEDAGDDRAHEHAAEHQVALLAEHEADDDRRRAPGWRPAASSCRGPSW